MSGLKISNPYEGEIWKDIDGYEGRYQVSNLGRVWSNVLDKQLLGSYDKNRYRRVGLTGLDKTQKTVKIHRIVCSHFNPVEGWESLEVNHKNGIKTDNRAENLEFVTSLENNRLRVKRLKSGGAYQAGIKNGRAKLTPEKVLQIIDRVEKDKISISQASREFGIARIGISKILQGKLWQSLTGRTHIDG